MATKLSTDEFVRRAREANRKRSQRQRDRFKDSGHVVMTVWIPQELRDWVAGNAAKQDESLGEVVTKILANAQRQQQQPEPESLPVTDTETVDMFLVPEDQTAKAEPNTPTFESTAERDARILELHQQKMAKRAIGRALGISESTVRRVIQKFEVSA